MTCVKIMTDMPLPTPRSVISSPIHMITAVPATMVMTIVAMRKTDAFGMTDSVQPGKSVPLRASSMYPVDCRIARPMVRYLVYWVIFAWPDWPSFLSVSSRGITTVEQLEDDARGDVRHDAEREHRHVLERVAAEQVDDLQRLATPVFDATFAQYDTFASLMPGRAATSRT